MGERSSDQLHDAVEAAGSARAPASALHAIVSLARDPMTAAGRMEAR